MDNELAIVLYEEGRPLAEIAEAIDTTLVEVNRVLNETDEAQSVSGARQEKHTRKIRRLRALADDMTMDYLEGLRAVIRDNNSTVDEKKAAFGEMDKVIRISKLSSDRVLLAEGKTTENIGLNGGAEVPFNVVFTKTYELPNGESTDDTDFEPRIDTNENQ